MSCLFAERVYAMTPSYLAPSQDCINHRTSEIQRWDSGEPLLCVISLVHESSTYAVLALRLEGMAGSIHTLKPADPSWVSPSGWQVARMSGCRRALDVPSQASGRTTSAAWYRRETDSCRERQNRRQREKKENQRGREGRRDGGTEEGAEGEEGDRDVYSWFRGKHSEVSGHTRVSCGVRNQLGLFTRRKR